MIFLYSTTSSSKWIFGIVVITSPRFSSCCPCWISASLAAALFCTVLILVLRLVSVVVLWFGLPAVGSALLPAVGFALLPAVGFPLLGSFHHRPRSSCSSRYPRTLVASLRSSRQSSWAVIPSVILSHHAPWLWFRLCFFFRVTLW